MISIKRFVGMNETPAVYLSALAYVELLQAGLGSPIVGLHWSYDAIVAYEDAFDLGCIVYEDRLKSNRDLWVHLGFVRQGFRGQGVYRQLWDELVKLAQEKGAERICGVTNVHNHAMRKTAKALGRREEFITLVYDVPKESGFLKRL